MLPAIALVASGLHMLVCISVDGTRSSVERIVVVEEIVGAHELAHRRLEAVGLGPGPVAVPASEIVLAVAVLQVEARRKGRHACWSGSGRSARQT